MNSRDKRVLYLINHTTLQESEISILRSLGFEVFINKIISSDEGNLSTTPNYLYDDSLTVPSDILQKLNNFNFYTDTISEEMSEEINASFGTVIIACFKNLIKEIFIKFKGRILFRVFGIDAPRTYSSVLKYWFDEEFINSIETISHRLWFAQGYPNLFEIEDLFLRQQVITLPVGLPEAKLNPKIMWTGNDRKILFVCSRIMTSPYYRKIYDQFKQYFGNLPHIIAGRQSIKVDDKNVPGGSEGIPEDVYRLWLSNCRTMFYHSQEPRHLHYHPLEAIACNAPLVFMRGGLLEKCSTIKQPGSCLTLEEAQKKIIRVLDLDMTLIKEIQDAQIDILEPFKPDFIYPVWFNNLKQIINTPL